MKLYQPLQMTNYEFGITIYKSEFVNRNSKIAKKVGIRHAISVKNKSETISNNKNIIKTLIPSDYKNRRDFLLNI